MSRAFVTGEFDKKSDKDTLDHVLSLSPTELVDLKNWRDFYKENYDFVGRLIGRFYQESGEPTEYFWQIERKVQFGLKQQAEERDMRSVFPPCNLEYKNKMTRFWCTNVSTIASAKESSDSWMHFKLYLSTQFPSSVAIGRNRSRLGRISYSVVRSRHENVHMCLSREGAL